MCSRRETCNPPENFFDVCDRASQIATLQPGRQSDHQALILAQQFVLPALLANDREGLQRNNLFVRCQNWKLADVILLPAKAVCVADANRDQPVAEAKIGGGFSNNPACN